MGNPPVTQRKGILTRQNNDLGVDHWAAKVRKMGEDPKTLGWWSYLTFSENYVRMLTVIMAYQVCKHGNNGLLKVVRQQHQSLIEAEMAANLPLMCHDLKKEWCLQNLRTFIEDLKKSNHSIILGMDAHEPPQECVNSDRTLNPYSVEHLLSILSCHHVWCKHHTAQCWEFKVCLYDCCNSSNHN